MAKQMVPSHTATTTLGKASGKCCQPTSSGDKKITSHKPGHGKF